VFVFLFLFFFSFFFYTYVDYFLGFKKRKKGWLCEGNKNDDEDGRSPKLEIVGIAGMFFLILLLHILY